MEIYVLVVMFLYLIFSLDVCLLFTESSLFTTIVSHAVDVVVWRNRSFLAGLFNCVYFWNNSVIVRLNNADAMCHVVNQ